MELGVVFLVGKWQVSQKWCTKIYRPSPQVLSNRVMALNNVWIFSIIFRVYLGVEYIGPLQQILIVGNQCLPNPKIVVAAAFRLQCFVVA